MKENPRCFGDYTPLDEDGWCQAECPLKIRRLCRAYKSQVPMTVFEAVGYMMEKSVIKMAKVALVRRQNHSLKKHGKGWQRKLLKPVWFHDRLLGVRLR